MKPILNIIKEELRNLKGEGVADKYAEKEFNIPDPNKEKEIKAISNIKPEDNNAQLGKLVGSITEDDLKINVYLNPKNLNDFDKNVRAITVGDSGDLFVTQLDGDFSHGNIARAVNGGGVYLKGLYNAYDEEHNITWHRVSNTNDFGLSRSYTDFANRSDNKPLLDQMIAKAKQKNPNYNFIPEYWLNLRYKTNNPTLPDTPVISLHENIITELENLIGNGNNLINDTNHNSHNLIENVMNENINVWHGSTEKFNNFDLEKIGSGDGKSLGGWGIYFSDSPEVSQRYYLPKGQLKQHEIREGKYFNLDQPIENGQNILNGLTKAGVSDSDLEEFQETYADNYDTNGKQVYDWLTYVLGGEKEASMFLESLGYIGNTMMDRWETGARNYVIFNTKSIIQ